VTGAGLSLALVAVLSFFTLLVAREMVVSTSGRWSQLLLRGLNIGLVPLGLAFVAVAGYHLLWLLS
jgi:hypothetical protein